MLIKDVGEEGVAFYAFLVERADDDGFRECAQLLADATIETKGDEELVLRFFA